MLEGQQLAGLASSIEEQVVTVDADTVDALVDGMDVVDLQGLGSDTLGDLMTGMDDDHIQAMDTGRQEAVLETLHADFLGGGAADFGDIVAEGSFSFAEVSDRAASTLTEEVEQFAGLDLFGGDLFAPTGG